MMPVVVEVPLRREDNIMEDTCKCELCVQYGCDCVETGKHDKCLCGDCVPQREPTVDNYGS